MARKHKILETLNICDYIYIQRLGIFVIFYGITSFHRRNFLKDSQYICIRFVFCFFLVNLIYIKPTVPFHSHNSIRVLELKCNSTRLQSHVILPLVLPIFDIANLGSMVIFDKFISQIKR
jgi:hypothetical protein